MPRATPIAVVTALAGLSVLACAGQARCEDRYGPPPAQQQYAPPPGAMLSWPGKTQVQAPAPQPMASEAPAADVPTSIYDTPPPERTVASAQPSSPPAYVPSPSRYDPARYQPTRYQQPRQSYAEAQPRYAPPAAAPPSAAPASAAPTDNTAARAQNTQFPGAQNWPHAHYYSVDRQFGLSPDPIPLPKQFFAGSDVDMAAPPPPPPLTSAQANTAAGRALIDQQQNPTGTVN